MYTLILDTETTDLQKKFCYDLGYIVMDMENGDFVEEKHFVIEQIWHNLPLFESAYYAEKRPLYVQLMRSHKATMTKWGYAMRELQRDIKKYNITDAYAYNSPFDDSVFSYNCDWFKTLNPLDNIAIHDIRGYANAFITNLPEYREFCEQNELFTEKGNYSATAESVYRFLLQDNSFEEAHMGVYDSQIEATILYTIILLNDDAEWHQDYPVQKIIARPQKHPFTIKINQKIVYQGEYVKKYARNDTYNFTTEG